MNTPSDCLLVKQALSGDLNAFEALYERYSDSVFRSIQAVVRDRAAAEDLLQECFVRAYRNLHRVDQSVDSLAPWLHRIALNLSYSRVSRRNPLLPGLEVMANILASSRIATSCSRTSRAIVVRCSASAAGNSSSAVRPRKSSGRRPPTGLWIQV